MAPASGSSVVTPVKRRVAGSTLAKKPASIVMMVRRRPRTSSPSSPADSPAWHRRTNASTRRCARRLVHGTSVRPAAPGGNPKELGWCRRRRVRIVIGMTTRIDPIADGIHRISTFVADGPPGGITFNQFLVLGDEPLLVHTGMRGMFPPVRDAVATVLDPAGLRWISSCHASRPDEYGSLDLWEALAPEAAPAHGFTGCFLCLDDLSSRAPRMLADGEVLDLGGRRVRWIDTPHVPGPWEAGVLFEEETRTLFCGDLFGRTGPAEVTTADDIVDAAIVHDQLMHGHTVTASTGRTLRQLAELEPRRLALMHGPVFVGDCAGALDALGGYFDAALLAEIAAPA